MRRLFIFSVAFLFALSLLWALAGCSDSRAAACRRKGGRVFTVVETGVGAKGAVGPVVSTYDVHYCVVDGKIKDIWS